MTDKMTAKFEQGTRTHDVSVMKPAIQMTVSPEDWEELCRWLTNALHGVAASVERREGGNSRLESHFHPVENLAIRVTANNVRTIVITVRTNGHTRAFEIAGPDSVTLKRNPAGLPKTLEIRNAEGAIVLHFCGLFPAMPRSSANAWGE